VYLVEYETKGKINRRSLYLFQKLYYAVLSIFNIRRCYNFHQLALVRDGRGGYRSFDAIYDLAAFEKKLDRFSHLATRNRTLAAGYFFLQFTMNMLSGNVKEKVQVLPLNMLLPGQKRNVKIPPKILLVSFGTVCDKYKYDADISRYCGQGFVFNRDGSLALSDSVSDMTLLKKGEAYG